MKKQNIYDNQDFYNGYKKIRDKPKNANDLIEIPMVKSLLGNQNYKQALDLGCGFGVYSYYLATKNTLVDAIDISSKMISTAKKDNFHKNISYHNIALEDFHYPKAKYDLIISTLTFHYINDEDIEAIFEKIYQALLPNGTFIFSIEHPLSRATKYQKWIEAAGKKYWPISDYFVRGIREETWLVEGVVKFHRTISDYFKLLIKNNFFVNDLLESEPSKDIVETFPTALERPYFLALKAIKGAG